MGKQTAAVSPALSQVVIVVDGNHYNRFRVGAAIQSCLQLLKANAKADPENGGDDATDWEDVDLAHEAARLANFRLPSRGESGSESVLVAGQGTGPEPAAQTLMSKPEDSIEFRGHMFTRAEAHQAVLASRRLCEAYKQGKRNGGSVDWSDIDEAIDLARLSVSPATMSVITAAARLLNGFESDECDECGAERAAAEPRPAGS